MVETEKRLSGLLAAYGGGEETLPIQGPVEPDDFKLKRLEAERTKFLRLRLAGLKSAKLNYLTDEEFLDRIYRFADRCGIELSDDTQCLRLLLVSGLAEIKEFKRPRGQPKKLKPMDYERYRAVRKYRKDNPHDKNCDDITAIRALQGQSHKLFSGNYTEPTLIESVSSGKAILLKAQKNAPEDFKIFLKMRQK